MFTLTWYFLFYYKYIHKTVSSYIKYCIIGLKKYSKSLYYDGINHDF